MYVPYDELPDNSKIWIYQSERRLTDEEIIKISGLLHTYTESWQAHGADLKASYRVMYNHFVILAVNEDANAATGCSIDDSVRAIKSIQQHIETNLLDRLSITFKDKDGGVKIVSKKVFREMIETGDISENTIVFNNMITKLGEYEKYWEVPMHQSWHANVFAKK